MRTVPLTTLRADSLLYANIRSVALVTPTELDRLINQALAEFYDLLVAARGHEYYEQPATLATAVNSAYIALPQDFYQLITLFARWSAQDLEEIESLDHLGDQVAYRNWNQWAQFSPKAFRLQRNLVELFPTPSAVTTMEVRYIPVCPTLSDPAQTFDGVNGWEKLVTSRVAMELLGLQALPMGFAQQVYEREKDRIEGLASERAAANPPTIRDVRFAPGRDSWWRRLPRAVT